MEKMELLDAGPYEIVVHGDLVETHETREQVKARQDFLRRKYQRMHIAVRDKYGFSTDLDLF
jgi:hypothetical protein